MRMLGVVIVVLARVAAADPPAVHDVGVVGGAGANVSATGGLLFELGLHVRDVVSASGNITMMGEWYHATAEARWFPTGGEWRPYLLAGVGELNQQDLFEDFISIGVGGEHRSDSRHWALYGEAAVDQPFRTRGSMSSSVHATPEGTVGVRYYY